MAEIQTREPERFASGDSLVFRRYLPGYLPADDWSLHYTLTAEDGTLLDSADSTTDGDRHSVSEIPWAEDIDQNTYPFPIAATLAGFAINSETNERHQIYYGQLLLTPNLGDATDDEPVLTEAQSMLAIINASLKESYQSVYQEVDLSRSKVVWSDITKLRAEHAYWTEKRQNEIQLERARNGKSTGAVSVPVFMVG